MAEKKRLYFPFSGLSDSESFGDQTEGTTRDAVNVRGFDPSTGRMRGGQRSGLTKFTPTQLADDPVRDLNSVSFHVPRVTYTPVTAGASVEWSLDTPLESAVKAIEVDWQGNLYVLDGTHRIIRYNADGERTAALTISGNDGFEAVGAPAVDLMGNIYVGMKNVVGQPGGKILRFAPDDDPDENETTRWDQIYSHETTYGVLKLRYSSGILYALTQDASEKKSQLVAIGFANTTVPVELWTKSVPYPANDFDFHEGNIFLAIGSNTDRSDVIEGQGTKTINWVPHELGNHTTNNGSTAADSKYRLHAWLDARFIGEASDAGELLEWPDRRFAVTEPGTSYWDHPTDTTDRKAFAIEDTGSTYWNPPTFSAAGFGGSPCVQFDGNQAMRTQPNTTKAPRSGIGTIWDTQGALIPGYGTDDEADTEKGTAFGFSTLFRIRDTSAMRVVFSQHGGAAAAGSHDQGSGNAVLAGCFAVIANATVDTSQSPYRLIHEPNKVAVFYDGFWFGSTNAEQAVAVGDVDGDGVCCVSVLFHRYRTGTDTTFPFWTVRVNGIQVNETRSVSQTTGPPRGSQLGTNDIWGPNSHTVIGAPTIFQDQDLANTAWPDYVRQPGTDGPDDIGAHFGLVFDPDELRPFIGDIVEVLTWLPKVDTSSALWEDWGITQADMARIGSYGGEYPYLATVSDNVTTSIKGYSSNHAHTSATTRTYATDIEKVEGYLMHKQGLQSFLGRNGASGDLASNSVGGVTTPLYTAHIFDGHVPATDGGGGSGSWDLDVDANITALTKKGPILMKLEPAGGGLVWAASLSGVGFAVRANSQGDALCTGEAWNVTADRAWDYSSDTEDSAEPALVRKVVDNGTAYALDGEAWVHSPTSSADGYNTTYATPQVAVDSADNFYVIFNDNSGPVDLQVYRSKKNGVGANQDDVYYGWGPGVAPLNTSDFHATQKPFAVALPPTIPDWPESRAKEDRFPEFLYLGLDRGTDSGHKALHKIRIVTAEVTSLESSATKYNPRRTVYTAVCDGKLWRFKKDDSGSETPINPGGSTSAIFRSTSPFVMSTVLREKMYFADGENVYVYNPKPLLAAWNNGTGTQADTVELLKAKSAGEVPKRPKLIASWRGRLVMARTADSAHNWYMSKIGEPDNWDYFPRIVTPDQAVSGGVSSVGLCPDIINTIIPYNDDLLVFGCDSSIVRLTGDPMMGGQMDLISDSIGMAFGKSWAKDPEGAIYFFASGGLGGVYRMSPQGQMERISLGRIDRRLMDLDLETYKARLVWNDRDEGLHVILSPYKEADAGDVAHYFWERRNGAWFEDRFGNALHHPYSATSVDGDAANDRQLLLGGEDGYVRFWDSSAKDDDGTKIDSRVLLGPFVADETGVSARWSRLEATLGSTLDGVRVELLASESSEVLGDVAAQGDLSAGQNMILPIRAKGAAVWMRLRNNRPGQSWALESLRMLAQLTSRRRERT
tara:strand:- start:5386 stop:9762 length:4377 start_codon:yes stop_codon:yes gene_type:complete